MSKPGTIKLNQVRQAYEGFPTYKIDYELQANGTCESIFTHSMTSVDVEFSFQRLNLGSPHCYPQGQALLFEHKNDVVDWCKLMNKLIGVQYHDLYFLPNRVWNKIKKYLDDDLKVLVFINKVETSETTV